MPKPKNKAPKTPKTPKAPSEGSANVTSAGQGMQNWNNQFQGSYEDAGNYSRNNPYSQAAQPYIENQLSGSMSNNPFMQSVYDSNSGASQSEGLDYLRAFMGGIGQGPTTGGASGGGGQNGTSGGGGNSGLRGVTPRTASGVVPRNSGGVTSKTSSGGQNVPDSTIGSGWFSENVQNLFDPSRLDPASDPTIQPMVDAFQREAQQSYYAGLNDLVNNAEAGGRYGSGMYSAQRSQAQDQYNEASQQSMAGIYQHARDVAIQNQMDALGLVNNRDISAGQIGAQRDISADQLAGQRASSASAASAAAAGIRAQQDMHNQDLQLQGIQSMLQSGQFGLGLNGQMSQLMSQNQLGALQAGQGYGQLGMSGFDAQQGFGGLGLNAMQGLGQVGQYQNDSAMQQAQQQANNRYRQQQANQANQRYEDQAPFSMINNLINSMNGLNNMGGYEQSQGQTSPNLPSGDGFNFADIMGGLMAGGESYYGGQR